MKPLLSVLIAMMAYVTALSNSAEGAINILEKSRQLYQDGKYDSTIFILRKYLRKNGKSPRTEHVVPLLIESLVRKGEFTSAHRLSSMYRKRFPQATYIPRIWYVEGVAFAKEEKYPQAASAFSAAVNAGLSPTLDSLVISNTELMCKYMAAEEFAELTLQNLNERVAEIITFYEIEKLVSIGQFAKAETNAEVFRQRFPRSRYASDLARLIGQAKVAQKNTLQIGIMAPVSGEEEEIGKKIVFGAQLAIAQLQPQNGQTVKTVVVDTRGNVITTAHKARELLDQHKISLIIGPVLSPTTTVVAAMLMNRPAVMISPTATDDGIADINENVFQMNVTVGELGRRIARYAIDNLSIKEFVVMAPQTPYGQILAQSFEDEVQNSHGEIIAEEFYEEGKNDYRGNFQNIRKQLLLRLLERRAIERGTDFDGTISRRDSILYSDSTLGVGGLYLPGEAEDIVMLAPQVMFNRVRTQLLGSSGWHQQKVIADGKKYVINAVISTTFELDQTAKEWTDFVKLYKSKYNSEPDRTAALGYDAAALVMKAIQATGSDDPGRIKNALAQTRGYKGLSGVISFEEGRRANSESAIYKITAEGFVRVQ